MNVLSYSYGKDSGACIHVCLDILKWPIDRIVTADVWATDTIPAVLPEMWEWQCKADDIIKSRYGITVEHVCARNKDGTKKTYEQIFYKTVTKQRAEKLMKKASITRSRFVNVERERERERAMFVYGFPSIKHWCNSMLKVSALEHIWISNSKKVMVHNQTENGFLNRAEPGADEVRLIGIAADEPERIARHINKPGFKLPLVEAGWTEQMCYDWCKANDLLAPTYETSMRGGCWFCHNQGVEQLRLLRKNHPELWEMLMKWDCDSPITYHADGHTVHDFDERFALEDADVIQDVKHWKWAALKMPIGKQINMFEVMK